MSLSKEKQTFNEFVNDPSTQAHRDAIECDSEAYLAYLENKEETANQISIIDNNGRCEIHVNGKRMV